MAYKFKKYLDKIEKDLLLKAFESAGWNATKTAKALGIHLKSFLYKAKRFGVKRPKSVSPRHTSRRSVKANRKKARKK